MKAPRAWGLALKTAPEVILLTLILVAVGGLVQHLLVAGYLRQPFIWDTNDTFMDWFNTAYWANRPGAYSVWRTVYPPLSFVFLQVFSSPRCYATASFVARDCDTVGLSAIFVFYVLGMALAFRAFMLQDRRTAIIRGLALTFSFPALFVLERGNLIIPCFIFFVLAHGDVVKNRWVRAVSAGFTINFKPYLLVPVLALGVKRRWSDLEKAGIATAGVYLLTWAILGSGSLAELLENTKNWVRFTQGSPLGEVYQTTSFNSFYGVLKRGFPILHYTDSRTLDFWMQSTWICMIATQLLAIAALIGTWLQPNAATRNRIAVILLALLLTQKSPGGYTELFILFLVFLEPWKRPGPVIATITCYLIAMPYEHLFALLPETHTKSWIMGREVSAQFGIGYGQFLRPAGLLLILFSLSADTLFLVWRAHRKERPLFNLVRLRPAALPQPADLAMAR